MTHEENCVERRTETEAARIDLPALKRLLAEATPGPWVHDPELPDNVYSDDATGSIIAQCGGFKFAPRPKSEIEANAALIAAAKKYLPALIERAKLAEKLAAALARVPLDPGFGFLSRSYDGQIHAALADARSAGLLPKESADE